MKDFALWFFLITTILSILAEIGRLMKNKYPRVVTWTHGEDVIGLILAFCIVVIAILGIIE